MIPINKVFITLRAKLSGAVYCNRSCLWRAGVVTAGGRCPNLTTASARAVFASLSALFSYLLLSLFCMTTLKLHAKFDEISDQLLKP